MDVMEVLILFMIRLVEFLLQVKQKLLNVFNMIATINESKILMKHILYDVIVDLMVANVIYIKLRLR